MPNRHSTMLIAGLGCGLFAPDAPGTDTCSPTHCPPFSSPFVCLWDPQESWCNGPDFEYSKPCVCEARNGTCSDWIFIDR